MELSNTFELFKEDIIANLVFLFLLAIPVLCFVIWGAMIQNQKELFTDLRKRRITFRLLFPFLLSIAVGGYFLVYSIQYPVRAILVIANGNPAPATIEVGGLAFEIEGNTHTKAFVRPKEQMGELTASIDGKVVVRGQLRKGVSILNLSYNEVLWAETVIYTSGASTKAMAKAEKFYEPLFLGLQHLVHDPWEEMYLMDDSAPNQVKDVGSDGVATRLQINGFKMVEFQLLESVDFSELPRQAIEGLIERGEAIDELVAYHGVQWGSEVSEGIGEE